MGDHQPAERTKGLDERLVVGGGLRLRIGAVLGLGAAERREGFGDLLLDHGGWLLEDLAQLTGRAAVPAVELEQLLEIEREGAEALQQRAGGKELAYDLRVRLAADVGDGVRGLIERPRRAVRVRPQVVEQHAACRMKEVGPHAGIAPEGLGGAGEMLEGRGDELASRVVAHRVAEEPGHRLVVPPDQRSSGVSVLGLPALEEVEIGGGVHVHGTAMLRAVGLGRWRSLGCFGRGWWAGQGFGERLDGRRHGPLWIDSEGP